MLLEQAQRLGIPVFWGRKAVKYQEDTSAGLGIVQTDTGETFSGDVVVAADGVHSKSYAAINGREAKVVSSGYTVSRTSSPRSAIAAGTQGASILPREGERPQFRIYPADNVHLMLMLNKDWCGFAFTHKDNGNAEESWSNFISKEELIESLRAGGTWDPAVIDFLAQVPSKIVDWKLMWREPQPQWTSSGGHIVQLGDAAHSFLPTSGNGATQAMEDGLSLAQCLAQGGKQNVSQSTKVHAALRFERVALLQKAGFVNRERLHHAQERIQKTHVDAKDTVATIHHGGAWIWTHNPELYAADNYSAVVEHLKGGTPFQNTNLGPDVKYEPWTIQGVIDEEKAMRTAEISRLTAVPV